MASTRRSFPRRSAVPLAAALCAVALAPAHAWRHFLQNIPNGNRVPCPDGGASGCLGGYCEALGHDGCSASGEINKFGRAVQDEDGVISGSNREGAGSDLGVWSVGTCAADSDSDGATNGDELGDFCCAWNGNDAELLHLSFNGVPVGVTDPAWDLSKPALPSCTKAGPPMPPSPVTILGVGVSTVTVGLPEAPACVCEYQLQVYDPGAGTSKFAQVRGDVLTIVLCGLTPNTAYQVSVVAMNRAGRSDAIMPSDVVPFTTLSGAPSGSTSCTPYFPADLNLTYTMYMNTIVGSGFTRKHWLPEKPEWSLGWTIVPMLAVFALASCFAGIGHAMGKSCLYTALVGHCTARLACRGCLLHKAFRRWPWSRDFVQGSYVFSIIVGVVVVALACTWTHASLWYSNFMLYSAAQVPGSVWRGCGYALAACMGLQILPVTRWSPWMQIAGISFERGLVFHRWVSAGSLVLAIVHGVGFAVEYSESALGFAYIFVWNDGDLPVNPLAGTLAGLFMLVLGVTAIGPVRRKFYELFLLGHSLYPFIFLFSILHTRVSESPVLPLLLPGIVLLAVDHILIALDFWLRPVTVLSARIYGEPGRRIARLQCSKAASSAWLGRLWPFRYEAGQYVYIVIPALSLLPHPFSISSAPTRKSGLFTLHIRENGGTSFTSQLMELIAVQQPVVVTRVDSLSVEMPNLDAHRASPTPEQVRVRSAPGSTGHTNPTSPALTPTHSVKNLEEGAEPHTPSAVTMDHSPRPSITVSQYLDMGLKVTGPFGIPTIPLAQYRHFVLFAGGIGVTPVGPLAKELQEAMKTTPPVPALTPPGTTPPPQSLVLAWAVREEALAADVLQDVGIPLRPAREGATAPSAGAPGGAASALLFGKMNMPGTTPQPIIPMMPNGRLLQPGAHVIHQRMSAQAVLHAAVEQVRCLHEMEKGIELKIAVVVCGPSELVDDVYAAVARYPQAGDGLVVHIHKELFAF